MTITDSGPCKKHIAIKVPSPSSSPVRWTRSRISARRRRFRASVLGGAPRTLVQRRFRKEVAGQVKSNLLMACIEQLDEDYKLNPITQPNLDLDAIELPEDGPLTFELDVEVQPEFDVPEYKG